MTNDLLTPAQQYERDIRLYGVTVARWLRAQKNLGLSVPVLAETERGMRVAADNLEAQGSTKAMPCGDRMPRTPAADKPFNLKAVESYIK